MTTIKKRNSYNPGYKSLFDTFFNDSIWDNSSQNAWSGGSSYPAVNIVENKGDFTIELAAPGLNKKDLEVKIDENKLFISYEKKATKEEDGKESKFVRREFAFRNFKRAFSLPEDVVDASGVDAKFESGLLRVIVPKKDKTPEIPARVIEVN